VNEEIESVKGYYRERVESVKGYYRKRKSVSERKIRSLFAASGMKETHSEKREKKCAQRCGQCEQ
jgi:hypothetical protein